MMVKPIDDETVFGVPEELMPAERPEKICHVINMTCERVRSDGNCDSELCPARGLEGMPWL